MIGNASAQAIIDDCKDELTKIEKLITSLGTTNSASGFLTRYALMKSSSTLENCYKTIIADYYEALAPSMSCYIANMVRNASRNANIDNIHKFLKEFDSAKHSIFKNNVSAITDKDATLREFKELANARNEIAHGSSTTLSFNDIKSKFLSSIKIMEALDATMK